MNTKKIFFICLFIMVILSSLAMASAASYENNGIRFTIPDEYSESDTYTITNDYAIEDGEITFFDHEDDMIGISVLSVEPSATLEKLLSNATGNYTKKIIADKEGFICDNNKTIDFVYLEDGKEVSIIAPDEDTVELIIEK